MSIGKIKQGGLNLLFGLILFLALLVALLMTTGALHTATRFTHLYSSLLLLSAAGLSLMMLLIIKNLYAAIVQLREKHAGARLTWRLLFMFVSIATIPTVLVYGFSLVFLNRHMDQWFDVNIETAMENALELSRASLSGQTRQAKQNTEQLMLVMPHISEELLALKLNELRLQSGALELTVMDVKGQIIAFNNAKRDKFLPDKRMAGLNLKQRDTYVNLESAAQDELHVRVISKYVVNTGIKVNQERYFHALYRVSEDVARLTKEVGDAASNYKQLIYLRQPLKLSFILILSLVLLLGILGAIWTALAFARYLAAPVRDMVKGTRALAAGDYSQQVPVTKLDELGLLVDSFNTMTAKLKHSHDEAKQSRQILEQQRAYLEVVLGRLSSGVLSLDCENRLHTFNTAACDILGLNLEQYIQRNFLRVCVENAALQPLGTLLECHLLSNDHEWQEQLVLFTGHGRNILLCRGTHLPDAIPKAEHHVPKQLGYVIVFDDITALVKAQRNAAWGEVARRLAHEIKNPLTPIRLSAERLRYKYMGIFPAAEAKTLDRMTHTIIQQVEAMRDMLNAFSDYARTPKITLLPLNLNQLISEVSELYQLGEANIHTHLAEDIPDIEADSGRLRQVLHNLIKNGIEATDKNTAAEIHIYTLYQQETMRRFIECRIQDNGCGVAENEVEEVFEPYITHKAKGTGLGLAIVKKIIEEHGGIIWLENNPQGGASVIMRFPQ